MSKTKDIDNISIREHFYSNKGNKYFNTYIIQKDETGVDKVVVSGKKCIYDMIQSEKDNSNIDLLYKRYTNGDMTVKRTALSLPNRLTDFRNMPNDLIGVNNFMSSCKDIFYQLPVDLKEKFNNNFSEFAVCVKNGKADIICKDFINSVYKNIDFKGVDNENDKSRE